MVAELVGSFSARVKLVHIMHISMKNYAYLLDGDVHVWFEIRWREQKEMTLKRFVVHQEFLFKSVSIEY